jgi:hypothetical protein
MTDIKLPVKIDIAILSISLEPIDKFAGVKDAADINDGLP